MKDQKVDIYRRFRESMELEGRQEMRVKQMREVRGLGVLIIEVPNVSFPCIDEQDRWKYLPSVVPA